MFGAAAMSLSSFCVVTNALRLNLCKLHDKSHDKKRTFKVVEAPVEEEVASCSTSCGCPLASAPRLTMKIEGMMCENCERHVKEALEAIDGVEYVEASHTKGEAVLTLTKDVNHDVLKEAVEKEDYKVLSFEGDEVTSNAKAADVITRTMKINGMMCEHCEAHVKEALEAIDGVVSAVANHEKGEAIVTLSKDVDNALLKDAVTKEDYEVVSIE